MVLPIEKITPEFEAKIHELVDKKLNNYNIREAIEDDTEYIIDTFNKSWHSTTMPFRPLSRKKLIEKVFGKNHVKIFIVSVDGIDSGFTLFGTQDNESKSKFGEISALAILPKYHRLGLGTVLGLSTLDFFRQQDVKELRCKVYKDNNVSKSFLEQLGFEEDHRNDDILANKIPI